MTGLAMGLGAMTGLPFGLVANVVGKQNIANAINAQAHAQNVAFNNALVAAQMGLTNSPANAAALASAIDSLSAANPAAQASISAAQAAQGISGTTGGAAAAAASAAAAAAAAAGHSDAAIGAASQAAADAAIGGASASAAAAAAADAANAAAADAADAEGGGIGTASSAAAADAAAGVAAADGVGMDGMGVGTVGADSSSGGGGGGVGGCVIATHAVNSGAFTKQEKLNAVKWCIRHLHGKWWGEAIRRGYRYCGNKAISQGKAANHYQEFKDYVNFATGKHRSFKTGLTFVGRSVQFLAIGLFLKD